MPMPKNFVVLDYETYYASDYSLRQQKVSTTEYVRDPRFKAHMVGIRSNRMKKAKWVPHHRIQAELKKFDWKKTALVAHHAHFDGLIASHHHDTVPAYYCCTLSMARALFSNHIGNGLDEVAKYMGYAGKIQAGALDEVKGIRDLPKDLEAKLGTYCAGDVDATYDIFMAMLKEYEFPEEELDLIDHTVRMYADPMFEINRPLAKEVLAKEIEERKGVLFACEKIIKPTQDLIYEVYAKETAKDAGHQIGFRKPLAVKLAEAREHAKDHPELLEAARLRTVQKALRSGDQFADLLRHHKVEPPMKISLRTEQPAYAFAKNDLDFQELKLHPKKAVRTLVEGRLITMSGIMETRARRVLSHSDNGNRFPVYLKYCGALTQRWSGGDKCNAQNFPRGSDLRKCLRAPKGYKVVVADSSQIEARMLAWYAGQHDLLQEFRDSDAGIDVDPYCKLAAEIYRRAITKDDTLERFVGKVGILGLGYGMGPSKYRLTLATGAMGPAVKISATDATNVVTTYRRKNYMIKRAWDFHGRMLVLMAGGGEYEHLDGLLTFHPEGIDLPNGLTIWYPDLHRGEKGFSYQGKDFRKKIYGGLATENIIQHLARQVVAEQALVIGEDYRILTLTHDEIVFLAPTRRAKGAYNRAIDIMRTPSSWCPDIPLNAEGGFDVCYSK